MKILSDLINIQINVLYHVILNKEPEPIYFISLKSVSTRWSPKTRFKISREINWAFKGNLEAERLEKFSSFFWYKLPLSLYRVNKHFIWTFSSETKMSLAVHIKKFSSSFVRENI